MIFRRSRNETEESGDLDRVGSGLGRISTGSKREMEDDQVGRVSRVRFALCAVRLGRGFRRKLGPSNRQQSEKRRETMLGPLTDSVLGRSPNRHIRSRT